MVGVADVSCDLCCCRFVWFVLLTFIVACVVDVSCGLCC